MLFLTSYILMLTGNICCICHLFLAGQGASLNTDIVAVLMPPPSLNFYFQIFIFAELFSSFQGGVTSGGGKYIDKQAGSCLLVPPYSIMSVSLDYFISLDRHISENSWLDVFCYSWWLMFIVFVFDIVIIIIICMIDTHHHHNYDYIFTAIRFLFHFFQWK